MLLIIITRPSALEKIAFPRSANNFFTTPSSITTTLYWYSIESCVARSAQVAARNARRAAEQIAADNARAATVATALAAAQSAAFAAVQAFIQSLPEPANFAPFLATYVAAQSQEAAASEQQQAAISKTNQNAVAAQNQASQVSSNESLFQLSIFAISWSWLTLARPWQIKPSGQLPMPWLCTKLLNLD